MSIDWADLRLFLDVARLGGLSAATTTTGLSAATLGRRVTALEKQAVRIRGYILPSFQQAGLTQFVLVRDNQECCFGPGAALHDFLDQTESAMELQEETGVGDELRQATLSALLARQACRADDMEAVSRLHRLWLQAGRPDQALRVLQDDGRAALGALAPEERADSGVRLIFWRIDIELADGSAAPALQRSLDEAEQAQAAAANAPPARRR